MKSKKVQDLLNLIKTKIKNNRKFSESEVIKFVELSEMELLNDDKLEEHFNNIINKYNDTNEYWDTLLSKY